MTAIPDFTALAYDDGIATASPALPAGEAWLTPEGIPVKPVYTAADVPQGELELAMSASSLTGLQAWLEAAPPGTATTV